MRRLLTASLLAALAAFLALPAGRAQSAKPAIKIAVVSTLSRGLPAPLVALAMRPLKTYMETETGLSGDIVLGGDALELGRRLEADEAQVGVFHGHEFAWAKKRFPKLEPIVVCMSASPNVRAVQVVALKCKAEGAADLKGTVLALPRENRAFCRLYAERRCVAPGCTPEGFYKRVINPIDAEDALDAVGRGKADSAIVEALLLEAYRRNKPAWAKHLRVVGQSEVFPPGVIAYRQGKFTEAQAATFRSMLVTADRHPQGKEVMKSMRVAAFTPAPVGFDDILDASYKAYPPTAK